MVTLRVRKVLACCAIVLASGAGCGGAGEPVDGEGAGAPEARAASSPLTSTDCEVTGATAGFDNDPFPGSGGVFRVSFSVTPMRSDGAGPIDFVAGLSSGAADSFTDLAAIVRFNRSGLIDARKGGAYAADTAVPYETLGETYYFDVDLDVPSHTYSVWVRWGGKWPKLLADRYPFRTEQASVRWLDTLARKSDTATGSARVCGVRISSGW